MIRENAETRAPLQHVDFKARNKSVLPHFMMYNPTLPRRGNTAVKRVRACGVVCVNRTSYKCVIPARNRKHARTRTQIHSDTLAVAQHQHHNSGGDISTPHFSLHNNNGTKHPYVLPEWLSKSTIKMASVRDLGISPCRSLSFWYVPYYKWFTVS